MIADPWGEFIDPKQVVKSLENALDEIASLMLRVKALEEQINQAAIITTTPIGAFQPRNRRFNT